MTGHFSYPESRESRSLRTVLQMQFLAHESADTDRVDWIFPSDRQLSGFPQLLFVTKVWDENKMDFCRQNFTPLEHKMMVGVCARFCKTANYLHWFNWLDRGLQTWCWKWENSQFHLAYMILETTSITMYTSLIPWRFLDLWAQCQFSQGQRQQQKTLLETSGKIKAKN